MGQDAKNKGDLRSGQDPDGLRKAGCKIGKGYYLMWERPS